MAEAKDIGTLDCEGRADYASPRVAVAPRSFAFTALPGHVIFGRDAGTSLLVPALEARGAGRILVLHTESEREIAAAVTAPLGDRVVGTFSAIRPHVPIEVAGAARGQAEECGAEWLLSIGGGSTTGTAKAVALELGLPIAAVPTTYAGSEMTPIWGITSSGRKETGRDPKVLPQLVVYDATLTASLPPSIAVPSAFNAFAHCVESFYAPGSNPVTALIAEEGIRALTGGIQAEADSNGRVVDPDGLLYGAFLAGSAFAVAGSGLHHKICHVLGGRLDLPHAETHTAVLPQTLAFNEPSMPHRAGRILSAITSAFDANSRGAATATFDLIEAAGGPLSLAELGMPRAEVAGMVDEILAVVPHDNPRPVGADDIFEILDAAFEGRRPRAPKRADEVSA